MKPKPFATEADLCAAFIAWASRRHPDVRCYAEWAGWDILVALPSGWQIGVQAKLRLNAEVIGQALPHRYDAYAVGPDFRALLVPDTNPLSGLADRLGLIVFRAHGSYGDRAVDFAPTLGPDRWDRAWSTETEDWNPPRRHELPPTETDAIAGSPCPVTLTPWKLGALAVLAELEVQGTITAKGIRTIGIDPGRWTSARWLEPAEKRGDWLRAARCPKFDEQHPKAYALALEKAKSALSMEVPCPR